MEVPDHRVAEVRQEWWWIFDPRLSLRARTALIIGGGTLAFTFALSGITGVIYQRAIASQMGANFENLAFQISDKLDRTIYERYRTLLFAADLDPLRGTNVSPAARRRLLESLQVSSPELAWIGFAEPSGRIVAATHGLFEDTSVVRRPWFAGAREQAFVGGVRELPELAREFAAGEDADSAPRFFDVAVPVTGADGNFAGVLGAHVRWDWSRIVQLSVVSEAAVREQIGATVYGEGGDVLLDSGASGWNQPPARPPMGDGRKFRGAAFENAPGGSTYLTGYSRSRGFREYRGIGWMAVVRQPVAALFAPVAPLRRSIAFWGSVLAAIGSTAGWMIAGRHARRLRSIAAAAERIREGDILAVLPRPAGENEMAKMCAAVSDLVEDLRAKSEPVAVRKNSRE